MPDVRIEAGTGIYQRPDAARLLRISADRLRRWLNGYTYLIQREHRSPTRYRSGPLIATDLPTIDGAYAISFLELMELRVIKALLERGVTLQHVRRAGAAAANYFGTRHPFASRRVFTDGRSILSVSARSEDDPGVVEWGVRIQQVISRGLVDQFLQEIDFDPSSSLAYRWWPKGRTVPVVLDPKIGFGAPTIEGTGIRTAVLARMASRAGSLGVADAFNVGLPRARAAIEFEAELAAA